MGAPFGNRNGAKAKLWEQALVRAARPKDLQEIAEAVVNAAKAGQAWAVTELGNRLDGKPVQPVDVKDERQHQPITNALLEYVAAGGKPEEFSEGQTVQ